MNLYWIGTHSPVMVLGFPRYLRERAINKFTHSHRVTSSHLISIIYIRDDSRAKSLRDERWGDI